MLILSKKDIEELSGRIIKKYKQKYIPEKHLCYNVDPNKLASLLNLSVYYRNLSPDKSILGMTSSSEIHVCLPNTKYGDEIFCLDGKSILIEKELASNPNLNGRLHFTIAHEIGHQIVYKMQPDLYQYNNRALVHCRLKTRRHQITDWTEWQADSLAAALLMPVDAIKESMFFFGLGDYMKVLSPKYSPNKYICFCDMAKFLGVSNSALSYRMEALGLLGKNCLYQSL